MRQSSVSKQSICIVWELYPHALVWHGARCRYHLTLLAIDDMKLAAAFRAAWPHATAEVSDPGWQRAFPLRRHAAAITRPPNPHGAFEFEAKTNLRSRRAHQIDRASVLLGARWPVL